jgi:hypothetical protein
VTSFCEKHSELIAGFLGDFGRYLEGMHLATILDRVVLCPECIGLTIFTVELDAVMVYW